MSFPWQRLNINVSDPAFSFLVIRHLNQLQDEDSSYIFHDIINFLLLRFDQDQFFSFEKSLEWMEFDKILKHYLHNYGLFFLEYTLYVVLRLAVHILIWYCN